MSSFTLTGRFKAAVVLINASDGAKFPLFVSRVMRVILGEDPAFTPVEREKLGHALLKSSGGGRSEQADILIDGCTYILEQTAYHSFSPNDLTNSLKEAGVDTDKAVAFVEVWKQFGPQLLEKLRRSSLAPLTLSEVNWRLHLELAHKEESKINAPTAIFQFVLKDDEASESDKADADNSSKKNSELADGRRDFLVEMNKDQLTQFYLKLEKIQQQMDNLN